MVIVVKNLPVIPSISYYVLAGRDMLLLNNSKLYIYEDLRNELREARRSH